MRFTEFYLSESIENVITLYHGTTIDRAESLIQKGWSPNNGIVGANLGNKKYLYVTNVVENALWFAEQNGGATVVKIDNVPISYLKVDPEDGTEETVEQELNKKYGLPAYLVLYKSLTFDHFSYEIKGKI